MSEPDIWSHSSACWGGNHINCGINLHGPRNSDTCQCECHGFQHPELGTMELRGYGCLLPLLILLLGALLIA